MSDISNEKEMNQAKKEAIDTVEKNLKMYKSGIKLLKGRGGTQTLVENLEAYVALLTSCKDDLKKCKDINNLHELQKEVGLYDASYESAKGQLDLLFQAAKKRGQNVDKPINKLTQITDQVLNAEASLRTITPYHPMLDSSAKANAKAKEHQRMMDQKPPPGFKIHKPKGM